MRKIKYYIPFIILLVFVIGSIGYGIEGNGLLDSAYASFALFFVSPVLDNMNRMIEFARWAAPISLASGLLVVLKTMIIRAYDHYRTFFTDATAVYCDNEAGGVLAKNIKHCIVTSEDTPLDVKKHILMFSDDEKNFVFFENNRTSLQNKEVYIKLDAADVFMTAANDASFFNVNELTARRYWYERNLIKYFENTEKCIKIAIIGFGELGQRIFSYGVLNNIYSLSQRIEYHIWGDSKLYRSMHSDFNFMNDDSVIYHNTSWQEDINLIAGMNRIIITMRDCDDLLPALQELNCRSEIDCCNPDNKYLNIYRELDLTSFGIYEEILTAENIQTDKLYLSAKELNYKYACMYGDIADIPEEKEAVMNEEWKKLDSFTKGSNIAAAEYQLIRLLINGSEDMPVISDTMAEMEHIRWCRYHYLNHWSCGKGEDGRKDSEKRLHPCLVPFEALSEEDKRKDYEAVSLLMRLKETI